MDSVGEAQATLAMKLQRPAKYWPDLHGKGSCVHDNSYDSWMEGSLSSAYLFDSADACCDMWYPSDDDCPHVDTKTTPDQVDIAEDPNKGYFYPHLSENNCRFGRNYLHWMKNYPKHYLFQSAEECCAAWYPNESNCPMAIDDGVQEGHFWITDFAYYPNWDGAGCAVGNSWPEWMDDPMNRDTHLFQTAKEVCYLVCQRNILGSAFILLTFILNLIDDSAVTIGSQTRQMNVK